MKFITMLVLALTMAASPVFAQTATRTPDQIMADIEATAKGISASAAALNAKVAELKQALTETRLPMATTSRWPSMAAASSVSRRARPSLAATS
jgi:hypothetical protein